jgi:hypothetical protein
MFSHDSLADDLKLSSALDDVAADSMAAVTDFDDGGPSLAAIVTTVPFTVHSAIASKLVTSVGVVTNALGQATVTYTWPVDAATIGVPHYTSYLVVDPGNGRPAALTLSNAHETRVGGNR